MTKITRNVRNKRMLLPKQNKSKTKSYGATSNAVRHFIMQQNYFPLTQTTYKSYEMDVQSIPYMQHQIWYVYSIYADRPRRSCLLSYMYKCEHFR